jgi:puromycin-sensitive aminopeptidase
MGTLGDDGQTQEAARAFHAAHEADGSSADPSILAAVVAILAHVGGEDEYERFLMRFKAAATPQEEQRYLHALAGFRPPALVRRTLELAVSGEVRTQDAPFLVRDLLMGVHSREQAWAFVKTHWDRMEVLYPSQTGLRRICEGITALATPALESDVRQFFSARMVTFGGKTLEQYLEQLRIAVAFRGRETRALMDYLAKS